MDIFGIVDIFDFDGTLFESPVPNHSRLDRKVYGRLMSQPSQGGYGWFQDVITLDKAYTTDIGYGFKASIVEAARASIADPLRKTILLTGRSIAFTDRVKELCATEGLVFDEYLLKPSSDVTTGNFKIAEINRLIHDYSATEVNLWEDRQKHVVLFERHLSTIPGLSKFSVNFVENGDSNHLPVELETEVVNYLTAKYKVEVVELTKLPEYYGIVLDDSSRNILLEKFKDIIPSDWRIFAHHMTVVHCSQYRKQVLAYDYARCNEGEYVELSINSIGISDDAIAVAVSTTVPSGNALKHITLAVPVKGNPYKSNLIIDWKPIDVTFTLNGTILGLYT